MRKPAAVQTCSLLLHNYTLTHTHTRMHTRAHIRTDTHIHSSVCWFKATQLPNLRKSSGTLFEWFHGIITRRQAEQLLTDKPNGTFLIRVSESRFGYSLSFR